MTTVVALTVALVAGPAGPALASSPTSGGLATTTVAPTTTTTTVSPGGPTTSVGAGPTTTSAPRGGTTTSLSPTTSTSSTVPESTTTLAPTATSIVDLQLDAVDSQFVLDVQAEVGSAQQALALAQAAQARAHADAATQAALLAQAEGRVNQLDDGQRRAIAAVQRAHDRLRQFAVAAYVSGGPGGPLNALLSAETIGDFARRRSLFDTVANESAAALTGYEQARTAAGAAAVRSVDQLQSLRSATLEADGAAAAADADAAQAALVLADRQALYTLTSDAVSSPGTDLPRMVLDAYQRAALAERATGCKISWWVLAGIGKVESNQGRTHHSHLSPNGDILPRILGPALDGTNGTQLVPATDGGKFDGDPLYDHAVGPMQFIPSTWVRWQRDGNADGVMDPNNIYDAALGAAAYLCSASSDLTTDDNLKTAYFSYNHSTDYANEVLAYARAYEAADKAGAVPSLTKVPLYTLAPPTTTTTVPAPGSSSPTTTAAGGVTAAGSAPRASGPPPVGSP